MEVFEIIEQIAATASRNEKQAILESNKDNELLKKVLYYTYESKLNYYIRKFPIDNRGGRLYNPLKLEDLFGFLDELNNREKSGNLALEQTSLFHASLTDGDAEIFKRIIERDMRAGFSGGTTNKVFPGLVTDFPCMLAETPDSLEDIIYPVITQKKMDGVRCFAIPNTDKDYEFFSRNGNLIDVGTRLVTGIGTINNNFVFDGELTVVGMDRKRGSGIINKAIKGTISEKEQSLIRYTMWDLIPVEDFWKGFYDGMGCADRYQFLNAIQRRGFPDLVDLVDSWIDENVEMTQWRYDTEIANGGEGLVLKTLNGPWEAKRSKHWSKIKGQYEAEFVITGWEYGDGKYSDKLGKLIIASADGKITNKVGSGLTDPDRETLGTDVIGKIAQIKFNDVITCKGKDTLALFLPIFQGIREDKDTANTFEEVMKIAKKKKKI